MDQGYEEEPEEPLDEGMDEFLCEYVDGSMDPVVLQAFEEYLRANPQMAEHARCLCQAKQLLSLHATCPHQTSELQHRLSEAIARDLMGQNRAGIGPRLGSAALVTSALGLMVILGMLFGTAMVQYRGQKLVQQVEYRESAPNDAHPVRTPSLPRASARLSRVSMGIPGPAVALPVLGTSTRITPFYWDDSLRIALALP